MKVRRNYQYGVSSIETAVLLPVVLAVMMMFFDITRLHLQYGLLEHATRHSLRELLATDWREQPLSEGRIQRMVEAQGYGLLDVVQVEMQKYKSLEALMKVKADENSVDSIYRPADSVYRVTTTLTTKLKFSPLAYFRPEAIKYRSTLIISQDLLFD